MSVSVREKRGCYLPYTKMQSGDWLVAGRCSEPKYRRVGKDHTPRCSIGIAAGQSKELDEKGKPRTIWINATAWRGLAEVLNQARSGDSVLVIGKLHTHEYEGKRYKDIQAVYVSVAQPDFYGDYRSAALAEPPQLEDLTEEDDGELPF